MVRRLLAVAVLTLALLAGRAQADERFIIVASTTSTEDSGLFKAILPAFTARTGIEVRVVARGTGQAIDLAKRGDADVLFVHHKPSEEAFVAEGYGVERRPVMYNDFVLVGPRNDPAGIHGLTDAAEALKKIAAAKAPFVSRGDDSGTHKAEAALWQAANVDPVGGWYRPTGSGMGPTLNTAAAMGAYTLADRGTWVSFANKRDLAVLVQGDRRLFNQYGVILANPARHPHVKAADGQAFIDWLVSPEGQRIIGAYGVHGAPLFFPNADQTGA
ncbi:MAG TPA: extracellular solute-binding protein [Azospirillaceae bacterium]|nr:extracellular solute-binding protein [Azospirillaceae bacterium]